MAEPWIGQILIFAGTFAPVGYARCDGSLLSIQDYEALYALIGTTYGGDGVNNFAVPNLLSRVPIHQGTSPSGTTYALAANGGLENVSLSTPQLPSHNHLVGTTAAAATTNSPSNAMFADQSSGTNVPVYGSSPNVTPFGASVGTVGGSQPHANVQPYLAINFYIATEGAYPPFD